MAFCCGAGFVTEVSYFALRSITPECFPSLSQKTIAPLTPTFSLCCSSLPTMTAAASEFASSLLSVTRSKCPGREQHISHPGIPVLQHPVPPPPDIHMMPPDDPLAPVPRDLTPYSITIPEYPNSAACFTCGDRIAATARKGAKRARVMHLRCCGLTPDELVGVPGWQDVSDVQRDCLVRDIYDEKEIKASDPAPQAEVEDDLAQDVTLESELWTFDEVEWHETTQDATTIKYVPVQVRPAVASLRERVAKAAIGNSSSPWTECSSTSQTPHGPTTQASPRQSGPVLRRSRLETHSKS